MSSFSIAAIIDLDQGLCRADAIPWPLFGPKEWVVDLIKDAAVVVGSRSVDKLSLDTAAYKFVLSQSLSFEQAMRQAAVVSSVVSRVVVVGGVSTFETALTHPDCKRLSLIRISAYYGCDRFFPPFREVFSRESISPWRVENGVPFRFEEWTKP